MGSTAAIPFGTVMFVILIWLIICFPLTILGGLTARLRCHEVLNSGGKKYSKIKKVIPEKVWYNKIPYIYFCGR
jgi:hypothetical protein